MNADWLENHKLENRRLENHRLKNRRIGELHIPSPPPGFCPTAMEKTWSGSWEWGYHLPTTCCTTRQCSKRKSLTQPQHKMKHHNCMSNRSLEFGELHVCSLHVTFSTLRSKLFLLREIESKNYWLPSPYTLLADLDTICKVPIGMSALCYFPHLARWLPPKSSLLAHGRPWMRLNVLHCLCGQGVRHVLPAWQWYPAASKAPPLVSSAGSLALQRLCSSSQQTLGSQSAVAESK